MPIRRRSIGSRLRDALSELKRDHMRHIIELSDILAGMGRMPPREGDMKSILAKGKVVMGGLMGDESILHAMRTNEADTNTAYERAIEFDGLPPGTRDVLERGLADERRLCQWIRDTLKTF